MLLKQKTNKMAQKTNTKTRVKSSTKSKPRAKIVSRSTQSNKFRPSKLQLILVMALVVIVGAVWTLLASRADSQGYLPNDLPSQAVLKASNKKVFAHYFSPYPISLDNKDSSVDYYTHNYLNPNGEGGKFLANGGLLRDRPLPRPVISATDWQYQDMKTEVQRADDSGLDGFTYDMLGLSGVHMDRLNYLLHAANDVDKNFKVMLMPDANSGAFADPVVSANAVAALAKGTYGSSLYRIADGRLVVSPFKAEGKSVAFWQTFLTTLQNQGVKVAFVPCFLNYPANAAAYSSISYGFSNWGNRSVATNSKLVANIADAHARGKIWMQPVSVQDTRPNQNIYDEADNTENFRTTWNAAITGGADWVQIPTWNDYSEGTQLAPSVSTGWSPLDINSYYLSWYKAGVAPAIKHDVVYLSHRIQPYAAVPTGGQTRLQQLRAGSSPARDTVEVLSFLTAQATVNVTIGGVTQSYVAPAGESSKLFPLLPGQVSATIVKADKSVISVASPFTVVARPAVQDLTYHFVSSARSGVVTAAPAPPKVKQADVTVTDINWSPAAVVVGKDVTFSATVKNNGDAPTPAGTIIGVSFAVNGKQVSWSDTNSDSLAPGESRVLTSNSGPAKVAVWTAGPAATYTVAATVNDVNRFKESSTTNNVLSKDLVVNVAPGIGLSAQYYNEINFTGSGVSRIDPTVNFNSGRHSPAAGIGNDTFSARWTGKIRAPKDDTYTFQTTSDDGVRLWVDGSLIVDNWTKHPVTNNSASISLNANQAYDIKLEYFENAGLSNIQLFWSSPTMQQTIIPQANLYPL
jgi:hypothetical protein